MDTIGLLLSGSALFLNGLMLLGKADEKNVGVFNLFVGAFQVIAPFYLIIVSGQDHWILYEKAATFLFGFTYLYVGITLLKGMNGSGLGYYSLWVSMIALVYVIESIMHYHDLVNAFTWLMWSLLWFLFFVINTKKINIDKFVGKVAIVQSWTTLTLPSLFSLIGIWGSNMMKTFWMILLGFSFLYFGYLAYKQFYYKKRLALKAN
ncbi:urease accessory protein UreI [Bacillus sp. MUM 116]|uniref:AmiS/UreI family transporter n=1 Tax=Bacillus sp. MUM 116 TaxID=1678002 RepID=UPI0008F5B689|nr:AmiS/UreI family transporter [Bacillus sp. MUM 116]OIK16015.1 urease accessory protein UreI [Bacillus sp. MUM 116]